MNSTVAIDTAIEAVSLDAAGTIIEVAAPVAETYAGIAARHGGEFELETLQAAFKAHFPAMPPMAFGEVEHDALPRLERGWWRTLVRRVVSQAGALNDFEAYFEELYDHYAKPEAWQLCDDVAELLAAVEAAGLKVGVLSNFDSRLPGILDGLGLQSLLPKTLYSTTIGHAKPAPEAFLAICGRLEVAPGACLHVGDNRVADLEGAEAAGLKALLLDRRPRSRHNPKLASIQSLAELAQQLDGESGDAQGDEQTGGAGGDAAA